VVLAVVAILVTVGIPSYRNIIQDNRLTIHSNMLVVSLALARTESIKRGVPVTVCASASGSNCTDSEWDNGWIVFTDNGVAGEVDDGDTVLRIQSALGHGIKLSFAGTAYIRYRPTGLISVSCHPCMGGNGDQSIDPYPARSWISKLLLALLPIRDAMAAGGGMMGGSSGGSSSGGGMMGSGGSGGSSSGGGMMGSGGGDSGSGDSGSGDSGDGDSGDGDSGSGGGTVGGGVAASAFSGTFILCDETRTSETGRTIEISPTGRVRIAPASCN